MRTYEKFDLNGLHGIIRHISNKFIVCCHGLFSNKNSKKYIEIEEMALEKGISCIRFDFRGCGESKGEFAESTLTNRIKDLDIVIKYISRKFNARYALFGSSFGGMVSIAYGKQGKTRAMAIMSTPYKIDTMLNKNFTEDLEKYDILKMAESCSHVLVIHGINDELVPCEHALKIYEKIKPPKKILFVDNDHSFSDAKERKRALEEVVRWFEKWL